MQSDAGAQELLVQAAAPGLLAAEKSDVLPCDQSNQHDGVHSPTTDKELSEQVIVAHESSHMEMLCDRLERASLRVENSEAVSMATTTTLQGHDISTFIPIARSVSVSSLTESALSKPVISPNQAIDAEKASASASSISASVSAIATSSRVGSSGISEAFSDIGGDVSSIADSESDELSSLSSCSSIAPHTSIRSIENVPCTSIQLEMHHLAAYDEFCPRIMDDHDVKTSKRRRKRTKEAEPVRDASALSPIEQEPGDTLFSDSLFTSPTVLAISSQFRDSVMVPLRSEDSFLGFDELRGILMRFVRRRHLFLDVGCGTSDICRQLVLHGYNHVYGIDIDEAKVLFQRQQTLELSEFVRIQRMNAAAMDFPDEFFDCVFTKAVLDEIACGKRFHSTQAAQNELLRALSEILRCVKPGGIWIVVTCQTPQPVVTLSCGSIASGSDLKPWWRWDATEAVIQQYAVLVTEYHAGIPRTFGEKPFSIRIYRRLETTSQRLRRIWLERDEERKSESEIKAFNRWQQDKRLERAENELQEREARQMIQEDMDSALWTSIINYKDAKNARDAIRKAILDRIREEERSTMVEEDSLSAVMQVYVVTMLKLVAGIICDLVNGAMESSQQVAEDERRQEIAKAGAQTPPERQGNHHDWILKCVVDTIDKIVHEIAEAHPASKSLEPTSACDVVTMSELSVNPTVHDSDVITLVPKQQNDRANNEMVQVHSDSHMASGENMIGMQYVSAGSHEGDLANRTGGHRRRLPAAPNHGE